MNSKLVSFFLIILAMISIQFGASVAKGLFETTGPTIITFLRLYTATFLLVLFWRPWRSQLNSKWTKPLILYGVSLGLMNLFFYWSLARIPLGLAVALEFIGPLSVALLKSRRPLDFVWLFTAAAGLLLILPFHQFSEKIDLIGALLALAAGGFWAAYIIFGQKVSHSENFGAVTAYGMLIAALVVTPFCLAEMSQFTWQPSILLTGLAVGVLSSALPYSLEMVALKNFPTHLFGLLMSLEPAVASLMGWLNLNESLTALQMLAIFLIMTASAGGTLSMNYKASPK